MGVATAASGAEEKIGLFSGQTDIGAPRRPGAVVYDATQGTYAVTGGGANMWFAKDSFHLVWQKVEGDVALGAAMRFVGVAGDPHRKGVLMFRQNLDQDSAYADIAVHGDGLTSLQFRETAGGPTREVQWAGGEPAAVRLEKVEDYVYLSLVTADGAPQPTGCSARVVFRGAFYAGIGVCAHDDNAAETVVFSQVKIESPRAGPGRVQSSLEYVKVPSGDRVFVRGFAERIQSLEVANGEPWRLRAGAEVVTVPSSQRAGGMISAAGDVTVPGASPDGKWVASLEHQGSDAVLLLRAVPDGAVREFMRLPDQAGAPCTIAWSPDSARIAYIRHQPAHK